MNARRAARELALLTLFQLDRQGNGEIDPRNAQKKSLQELTIASVRALTSEAEFQIRSASEDMASVCNYLRELELDHKINTESAFGANLKPVPIPTNREMVDKLEQCLRGAEMLHEAMRLPEWMALVRQDDVQSYASALIGLVVEHMSTIDEMLGKHMEDWRMDRLVKMDAYILRVAAAEMQYMDDVDAGVSINEAVDLAKQFSSEESYRLINGILGSLASAINESSDVGIASHEAV